MRKMKPMRASFPMIGKHPFEEPLFMRALDLTSMQVPEFPKYANLGNSEVVGELCVGMQFNDRENVIRTIKHYSISKGVDYKVFESEPNTFYCKCDHSKLDADTIAECIKSMVESNLSFKIKLVINEVQARFGYTTTYRKAWMTKQKAIEKVYGEWEASYEALPQWSVAMCDVVCGSIVQLDAIKAYRNDELVPDVQILRCIFWSFAPCIRAFRHCKPLVQVDGIHLYGKYNGALLDGVGIIFDRHKSINVAIKRSNGQWEPPKAFHMYCIRHIAANFLRRFKTPYLHKLVVRMGYSRTESEFNIHYEQLRQRGEVYIDWLNKIPREKWVLAYDGGHRWGHMTTNLVECINSVLKGARCEAYTRKKAGHIFSEAMTTRLQSNEQESRNLCVTVLDRRNETFLVQDVNNNQEYKVQLRQRYCDCGDIQTDRYLCRHVIAACSSQNIDWRCYVEDVYKINELCKVYKKKFGVIGNESTWRIYRGPKLIPDPNLKPIIRGRPKSTRFLNEMDRLEMRRT
ncbi:uncharacterized protein LOC113858129 [Abrus precatorius]|uniref:Uncharacterized protein LOC113858129 n=1 Tax=Abrus precatorius TaxID=3816 RepID=A0A8B8KV53_ABRPR|nr:uncharacterized protein LOC113858129 [Abrus precatorius]